MAMVDRSGLREVLRTLQRMSADAEALLAGHSAPAGQSLADMARELYSERRRRDEFFPDGLFGEPAWDLLLALYSAHDEGRRVRQLDVMSAARVPATTAIRLVADLKQRGLIATHRDAVDRRLVFVELSAEGLERMTHYLSTLLK